MITRKVKLESLIAPDSFRYYQTPNSKRSVASSSRSPIVSTKSIQYKPKTPESINGKPLETKEIQSLIHNLHKRGASSIHQGATFQSSKRLKSKKPSGDFYKKYNLDSLQLIERILSSAAKKTHYDSYAASQARSAAPSPSKKLTKTTHKKKPKIKHRKLQRKSETPCEEISAAPLVILKGELVTKAPKLYKNQLFADVYDEMGNHDRVLDTSDCKDYDVIYTEAKLNIQPSIRGIIKPPPKYMNSINTQDISNVTSELLNVLSLKPPENSYIEDSTKETPNVVAKYSKDMDLIDQLHLLLTTSKKKVCFQDSLESSTSFC